MKHWDRSEQSWKPGDGEPVETTVEDRILKLPNHLRDKDNKALRVGYLVEEDKLYIMTSIIFPSGKRK